MKKIIAVLLLMVLVITACAPGQTTINGQQTTADAKKAVETRQTTSGTPYEAMLEQVEKETVAKNNPSIELVLPLNIKSGKVGDTVVIGLNFNQVNRQAAAYYATINFVEGRDNSYNRIEVDPDTIKTWIRTTQTEDFALAEKASQYIPAVFTIGSEIKPGVKTEKGAYQFEVQLYERKDGFGNKLDNLVKQVYVKVE